MTQTRLFIQLIIVLHNFTPNVLAITCDAGEYLDTENVWNEDTCRPCPTLTFMAENDHRNTSCNHCTESPVGGSGEVIIAPCTPVSDTQIGCDRTKGSEKYRHNGHDSGKCTPCTICKQWETMISFCTEYKDTVCQSISPSPNTNIGEEIKPTDFITLIIQTTKQPFRIDSDQEGQIQTSTKKPPADLENAGNSSDSKDITMSATGRVTTQANDPYYLHENFTICLYIISIGFFLSFVVIVALCKINKTPRECPLFILSAIREQCQNLPFQLTRIHKFQNNGHTLGREGVELQDQQEHNNFLE